MSRIVGFIIVIFVFLAALAGFYFYLKIQKAPESVIFNAVPVKTAMLFEIKKPGNTFDNLNESNTIWSKITSIDSSMNIHSFFKNIPVFLNESGALIDWKERKAIVSVQEIGKNKFSSLLLFKVKGKQESNRFLKSLQSHIQKKGVITELKYNHVKIFKCALNNNNTFFATYHKGIVMISDNQILIEDAIRQTESETGILNSKEFLYLVKTAGENADATVYVQFNRFSEFIKSKIAVDLYDAIGVKNFAEWAAFDINIKKETVLLNGFAVSGAKQYNFSKLFEGQNATGLGFLKYVPSSAEGFVVMGISNLNLYAENLKYYMEASDQLSRYNVNLSQIREVYGNSTVENLNKVLDGEIAYITMPDANNYFLIKTTGFRDANDYVKNTLKKYNAERDVSFESLTYDYNLDSDAKFEIFNMPLKHFPTRIFGPWFNKCNANYVTAYKDYLVFGNTVQSLKRFLYDNTLEKTMFFDKEYSEFENFLSAKHNFYLFMPFVGNSTNLINTLNTDALKFYKDKQNSISEFYGLGWQFLNSENKLYNNIVLHYKPSNQIKAGTQWESRLDTLVGIKPVLVINHSTNEKEIFVQDMNNNIYLINNKGRILWKKKINKPILGEVVQVDYYKNGKLQFLFNTEDELHLLDRNGNNVEKYPFSFESKAVAPLAVFDYDNRKNYRIFIPFEDRSVKAYSIEGKKVIGYKFNGADNDIISQVQYFRVGEKDYIVITDDSRIYFTDRQGNERIKLSKLFAPSVNNKIIFQPGSDAKNHRFIRTSTDGKVNFIYLDGNIETVEINKFTDNHFFAYRDVTGDKVSDYVFVDENYLSVFNSKKEKEFKVKFASNITLKPAFYKFSSSKLAIGITDSQNRKIYMIDQRGSVLNGFPMPGKTRFSIGVLSPGSNRYNLIVGGDNQYLYNYKLN